MLPQELVQQLLGLSDVKAQMRLLREHVSLLDDQVAEILKEQADQFVRADIQHSLQMVDLLLNLAEITDNPHHRALGLLAQANAFSYGLGEYEKAIDLYDQAAGIYQSQKSPVRQAQSQLGKLWALTNLGRYAEAQQVGEWAGHILEEHAEWEILARFTVNLAIASGRAGNDAKSLEMFDRTAALYDQLGMKDGAKWLRVQHNRAVALRNLGHFQDSIQASRTAWEGLERLGHKIAAARARQNMAHTQFFLGQYNEALEHLDLVRDVFLADGRRHDAMLVELFTSDCLLQLRRFNDVLEKCQRVRSLFSELGTRQFVAQAIVDEAVAYAELGRFAEASASLAEARQIFEAEGNHTWVASTDLETAAVLLCQGDYNESLAVAEACVTIFAGLDLPVEGAQARLIAARAALALGQQEQALRLTTEALDVGEEYNVPTLRYQGQHLLGALAADRGALPEALAAYDRAIEEVERLRGRLMVEYRVGFAEDKEGIYEDAVSACLDMVQPLRGLEYAERAKSRALLDLVAHRLDLSIEARTAADRPLVEEIVRLRARRDRLYRRWESDVESGERSWSSWESERSQAQQEVLDLEKRITELWHRLLIHNADYAREASLWTVRTEPVQPYLPTDSVLLEYFVVHGRPVAFLVTADDIQAQRLDCDLTQIQTLMQLLWLNLKAVPRTPADRLPALTANAQSILRRIHGHVVAPLADGLADFRRLIIVPHGPLHYLPFHALHDGTSYLLEQHEISYLPGANFLRYCTEAPVLDKGLMAVGHSHGGNLPHTLQEARAVAELLDGQVIVEDEATLLRLRQAASQCRVLHLAAHGDFRADNPLFSGIYLSDGWLTTLDIFDLRLKASLVTLSACQTGRNVVGGGDELLGLMRAFLGAGAASLVLSLWAVEDLSTAQLMRTFYQHLAGGETKAEALRQAQLRLLRGQGEQERADNSHPYFWAPFFLVGNSGRL